MLLGDGQTWTRNLLNSINVGSGDRQMENEVSRDRGTEILETRVIDLLSLIEVSNGDRKIGSWFEGHIGLGMVQTWLSNIDLVAKGIDFSTHWADGGFGSALGIEIMKTILVHPEFIGRSIWLVHSEDGFRVGNIGKQKLGSHILQ